MSNASNFMTYFSCLILLVSYLLCLSINVIPSLHYDSNSCASNDICHSMSAFLLNSCITQTFSIWFVSSHFSGNIRCSGQGLRGRTESQGQGTRIARQKVPNTQTIIDNPCLLSLFCVNSLVRFSTLLLSWGTWGGVFLCR